MPRHYHIPPAQQLRAGFVIVTLVTGLVSAASASSFRERTGCTDYWVKVKVRAETLGTPGADRTVHGEESWL